MSSNMSNESLMEKMGNKFYVPLKWNEKADFNEILEYVISLKLNQISIKNFNNLAVDDSTLMLDQRIPSVSEIIEERVKMVDWLIKICKKFNLKNETLFKAINLIDYYLSKSQKKILRIEEIHFITVVCLNIACKFEEINCNYLVFFRDNLLDKAVYELNDLIKKETEILMTLQFKVNIPNYYQFNNALMQVAIHNLFNYNDEAEIKNVNKIQKIYNELIKHNEIVTKKFAILKESIFSSALNSGIVCFKMTLISMKLSSEVDTAKINDLVDSLFLSKMFKSDYIQRCEIVASNLYNILFSVKAAINNTCYANNNFYNNPNTNANENPGAAYTCHSTRNCMKKQKDELVFHNNFHSIANNRIYEEAFN